MARQDYRGAESIYLTSYDRSLKEGDKARASRCLQGVAMCRMARFEYRQALKAVLDARRLALDLGDPNEIAATATSLSVLYLLTNDVAAAEQSAVDGEQFVHKAKEYVRIPLIYIRANIAYRQNRIEDALRYYREGIQLADSAANDQFWILGLSHLSYVLLYSNRADEAEGPMLEVYRFRLLHKDPDLHYSYALLAELARRRGQVDQGLVLIEKAVVTAKATRGFVPREFLLIEAGIQLARRQYDKAHAAYFGALATARRWRLELLPADAFRIAGEASLASLYDSSLENAARLYFDLGRKDAISEAWLAAEDWRSSSLRSFLAQRQQWQARVSPDYWEVLAEFRRLDAAALRSPTATVPQKLERLRVKLAEMESFAGITELSGRSAENSPSVNALNPCRSSLSDSEVYISFQLGEHVSHRWTLSKTSLDWRRLPARSEIIALAEQFRTAVARSQPDREELGKRLGDILFTGLSGEAERAEHWTLALDDVLQQVPIAALSRAGQGYLIERHSMAAVPGAWSLLNKLAGSWNGSFIGVGDAIYNVADPRWQTPSSNSKANAGPYLPRLASSSEEVSKSARAWNGTSTGNALLLGADATRTRVTVALEQHPAIIHFATHVVSNPAIPDRADIALSLASDRNPELLTTSDVAHLPGTGALVVMNGCRSSAGLSVAGSGLIGLVRAWLMSGARAVVASLWPTPDDRGIIFESFYRELRNENRLSRQSPVRAAAVALRRAQLEMLRTHTWRAEPKYWATYTLTGRNN